MPCNIGRKARRLRLLAGLLSLLAASVLGAFLLIQGDDRWWRLLVAPPLQMGLLGIFQYRTGICAAYSALGIWECPTGTPQKIPDPLIENQFKDRAKAMLLRSFAATALLMAFFLLI